MLRQFAIEGAIFMVTGMTLSWLILDVPPYLLRKAKEALASRKSAAKAVINPAPATSVAN
jgi:hypothetical protein